MPLMRRRQAWPDSLRRPDSLKPPVQVTQRSYFKTHLFKVSQYPSWDSLYPRRIDARHRARVDQPAMATFDICLHADMRSVTMPMTDQIIITGTGECIAVIGHMGDE